MDFIKHSLVSGSTTPVFIHSLSLLQPTPCPKGSDAPKAASGCLPPVLVLLLCVCLLGNKAISCLLQTVLVASPVGEYVRPHACSRTVLLRLARASTTLGIFLIVEGPGGHRWPAVLHFSPAPGWCWPCPPWTTL